MRKRGGAGAKEDSPASWSGTATGRMSERGVVDAVDVERGGAVVAEPGLQRELVVRPDARAQVVEEFDDGQCLLGRPVRVDQEGQALGDARGPEG